MDDNVMPNNSDYLGYFKEPEEQTLERKAEKAKLTLGQYTAAQIVIGLIALILIVAALVLAWDGIQALRHQQAKPVRAGAKG